MYNIYINYILLYNLDGLDYNEKWSKNMKVIGLILKRLREKNNKTLEELITDINEKYNMDFKIDKVTKWEDGKLSIKYEQLKCLALYYNVTTDFLLGFNLNQFTHIIDLRNDLEITRVKSEVKEEICRVNNKARLNNY